MSFFDLFSTRHSVREFEDKPVSQETIKKIASAAISAPSAGNLQAYQIFTVTERAKKESVADAAHGQSFVADAAALFVFCADPGISAQEYGQRGSDLYSIQDATIACAYSQLAAHLLGLGTVWVGSFEEEEVSRRLQIPKNLRPVAILVIGHHAEKVEATPRRPLSEMVHSV